MNKISFSDLSCKEVISCLDCTRLGYIVDLEINLDNASITSIIVEKPAGVLLFWKKTVYTIPWECISKIGDDLIIVDYIPSNLGTEKQPKKSFIKGIFNN